MGLDDWVKLTEREEELLKNVREMDQMTGEGFNIIFMEDDQLIKAKIKSTVLRFKNQEKGITSYNARIDGESKDQRQLNL